jgi:hypothetical protein
LSVNAQNLPLDSTGSVEPFDFLFVVCACACVRVRVRACVRDREREKADVFEECTVHFRKLQDGMSSLTEHKLSTSKVPGTVLGGGWIGARVIG